jgi:KipI family sensor histidine kinase inhibitor
MSIPDVLIEPLGESMVLLRFGSRIDADVNAAVHAAASALRAARLPGMRDLVPAYATLAIDYDPQAWTGYSALSGRPAREPLAWQSLADAVRKVLATADSSSEAQPRIIDIPVCYGDEHGPDLDELAVQASLAPDEVITRHTAGSYRVAMLGFAPGFPYLLGLDRSLHTPRRANPRLRVAAGSVAIGGAQTGIYPRELPGGWSVIGRTPLVLFETLHERPALLAPGDQVRFFTITSDEFIEMQHHPRSRAAA